MPTPASVHAVLPQRKELLSGAALPALQHAAAGGNTSQAAEGAEAVTESLRRSRMALAQQLEHTAGNLEVTGEMGGGGQPACCFGCSQHLALDVRAPTSFLWCYRHLGCPAAS